MNDPRCLVVILSETRGHRKTFTRFRKNVLDALGADLALCVADNEREEKDNPFYTHAKYTWTCPEYEDWGDLIEACDPDLHPHWHEFAKLPNEWMGGIKTDPPHRSAGGILIAMRRFLLSSLTEADVLANYDYVIWTRSDFVWLTPHPPLAFLNPGEIWIADGEHYGGWMDRHLVVPRDLVPAALDLTSHMHRAPEDVIPKMQPPKYFKTWNIERIQRYCFDQSGLSDRVRPMPYCMFSAREKDGPTSWSAGDWNETLGVHVKYKDELRYAVAVMKTVPNGIWTKRRFRQVLASRRRRDFATSIQVQLSKRGVPAGLRFWQVSDRQLTQIGRL